MMKPYKTILPVTLVLILLGVISGCKHNHKPASAELVKAYEIQQEALTIHKEIEKSNTLLSPEISQRTKVWLENMIEIPGMDHDHSNCNHDHHRQTISITDSEMLTVQTAWRDTILSIKNDIK